MTRRFLVKKFDPLPLQKITQGKHAITANPGEHIFKQGASADCIFYLHSGTAKESIMSEQGKIAVVRMLEPGTFFGTSSMDDVLVRTTSAIAITKCSATAITTSAMRAALDSDLRFARLFISYLAHHTTLLEAEKVDLLFNSVEVRLAKQLLILAHVAEGPPKVIGPEITQELLADMIGTTRPRVNFFLGRFRQFKLIEYGSGGMLVQPRLLKAVLEDSSIFNHEEV